MIFAPWGTPAYNNIFIDSTLRTALINNIVTELNTYAWDSVSMDWECDNHGPPLPTQAQVNNFFNELYTAINPIKISSAMNRGAAGVTITTAVESKLDWIGIMTYDTGVPATWYETLSGFQTELTRWTNAGFAAAKIIGGVSFAGRLNGSQSTWIRYGYIIDTYNPDPSLNVVADIYYNGADLVDAKARYVRDNSFGGAFCYTANLDQLTGDYRSLLKVIYNVISGNTLTPPKKTLTITKYAPILKRIYTPGVKALSITKYAPTLKTSITPGVKALALTTYAPTVITASNVITIPKKSLTLTTFAPTVTIEGSNLLTPDVKALTITSYAPTATSTLNVNLIPGTIPLVLTTYAPYLVQKVIVPKLGLTLTTYEPGGAYIPTPDTAQLHITTYPPYLQFSYPKKVAVRCKRTHRQWDRSWRK